MAILEPAIVVESIINNGFATLIANASVQIPLILAEFPVAYQQLAIAYLTDPTFKVTTLFQYAYDPSILPSWNIVLSNENEAAGNQQMYLGDIVDPADNNPNTEGFEQFGSDWVMKINVYIRAQKDRQCIVLYALTKWIFLQNRLTLEAAGMKANVYSGSDVIYEIDRKPTFVFTRLFTITCRALQTVDVNISSDPTVQAVQSAWPTEVKVLPQSQVARE